MSGGYRCDDVGLSRHVPDEGQLAEIVARLVRVHLNRLLAFIDRLRGDQLTLLDHVELIAVIALGVAVTWVPL
jgi:hypothetical protein